MPNSLFAVWLSVVPLNKGVELQNLVDQIATCHLSFRLFFAADAFLPQMSPIRWVQKSGVDGRETRVIIRP